MILQALHDLAVRENLIPDPDFEIRQVAWIIRIGTNGSFLGIESNEKPRSVPKRLASRSGKHPPAEFFVENPLYALGISIPEGKYDKETCKKRLGLFVDRIMSCADETGDSAVNAVSLFLKRLLKGTTHINLPKELKSNDLIAFSYLDDECLVHERKDIAMYWRELRKQEKKNAANSICLVTGNKCVPALKHKKLKHVPQKQRSDIALSPCNENAFESYGWKEGENAVIGAEASDLSMTALNRLLDSKFPNPSDPNRVLARQHVKLSIDTIVCFWTKNQEDFSHSFAFAIEVDEKKIQARPEQVIAMYKSLWKGVPYKLTKPDKFYSLVLSGGKGRATIRDWIETNTQSVVDSLAQYFADLKIVRNCPPSSQEAHPENFPLPLLLESLSDSPKEKKEGIPAAIGAQFYRASIDKRIDFPQSAFFRAISRYRAELPKETDEKKWWETKNYNDARAAIIKAYLNRKNRKISGREEVNETMNPHCKEKGYLLGQLMAVLERVQTKALGNDINATLIDRYFAGASASPKSVFVGLLKNARYHAKKAKDIARKKAAENNGKSGSRIYQLENLIDQICSHFEITLETLNKNPKVAYENGFPAYLKPEQQGMFVLGYHQMRKWLWMNEEERKAWNAEHSDAPRAYLWKSKKKITSQVNSYTGGSDGK